MITSSDGQTFKHGAKDNLPIWGRTADWHDYSGTVNGTEVKIMYDWCENGVADVQLVFDR